MFRNRYMIVFIALLGVFFLDATAEAQKIMSVQVREAQLRATPSFLGKILAKTSYGDQVTVLDERGDWQKVSIDSKKLQGWMHNTALTSKRIALKAGQENVGSSVSSNEIALAGKGFNEEVEKEYRKTNKNIDYTWINRMETINISQDQMLNFVISGKLSQDAQGGKP